MQLFPRLRPRRSNPVMSAPHRYWGWRRAIAPVLLGLTGISLGPGLMLLQAPPAQANLSDITGTDPDVVYADPPDIELAAIAADLSEDIDASYAACLSLWEQDDPITLLPDADPCETLEDLLAEARQFLQSIDAQTLEQLEADIEQLQRRRIW